MASDSDKVSVFSYEDDAPSDSFNLSGLNDIVDTHFEKPCMLVKLAEGGYHKVGGFHNGMRRRILIPS